MTWTDERVELLGGSRTRVDEGRHAPDPGKYLGEQLQPFAIEFACENADPGEIARGPSKGGDQTVADDIVRDRHNRNARCGPLRRASRRVAAGEDSVRLRPGDLHGRRFKLLDRQAEAARID